MSGVCSYGIPISKDLIQQAFNGQYMEDFLELNRLCVDENLPKNALSFFVGQTLNMLPKPKVIVSYADSGQHHHGYIYQATNWIYTGLSNSVNDVMVKGFEGCHPRTFYAWDLKDVKGDTLYEKLCNKFGEENVYFKERSRKHRYFYLIGDKRQRKAMRKLLKYEECSYPKGDNERYDASHICRKQGLLF